MFLPVSTDAPIYHRPFATIGLMALNVWAFVITQGGEAPEGWILTFGNGLHPSEWVKAAFLHFGFWHLFGNMIFLFMFGLIIEGKLGPLKFLLLYFAVCVFDGMVGQTLMLGYTGLSRGAGGASGAIFALMVIAWLWAPQNEIEFVGVFGQWHTVWIDSFEVTVQTVALYYVGTNLLFAWALEFEISTPVLHLFGAGVGLPIGLLFLKKGWVDCEGWDLISLKGRSEPRSGDLASRREPARKSSKTEQVHSRNRLRQVEELIAEERFEEAWQAYEGLRDLSIPNRLAEPELESLIKGVVRLNNWNAAALLLEEALERFEQNETRHRLALASILTRQLQRPKAALKVLQGVTPQELDPQSQKRFQQIQQEARRQIDQGVLEIPS